MKWCLLIIFILCFSPFYAFVLSKCISLGKLSALRETMAEKNMQHNKEKKADVKKEK